MSEMVVCEKAGECTSNGACQCREPHERGPVCFGTCAHGAHKHSFLSCIPVASTGDHQDTSPLRSFPSGATRNSKEGKLAYHRFTSPSVTHRYCEYMDSHRVQADGSVREPDNWKRGIPVSVYRESLYRHVHSLAELWEGKKVYDEDGKEYDEETLLCAIRFNTDGLLFERLVERGVVKREDG